MPKRFVYYSILISIIIICIMFLTACGKNSGTNGASDAYRLYFRENDLTAVAGGGALRSIPAGTAPDIADTPQLCAEMLLAELLSGPQEETLSSPIPAGTVLRSLELENSLAKVDFSRAYGTLSGISLTMADYAVTLTLTQIPEISLVEITVEGQPIAYRDRQIFTARDVLLQPDGDVVGTVTVQLYFPNADGELVQEEREIALYEGDTQTETAARALEEGPENRELSGVIPDGLRLLSVRQENDICFVNLSSVLPEHLSADKISLALRALDDSLCSLESVREVRYLVDGEFLNVFGGAALSEPYAPVNAG